MSMDGKRDLSAGEALIMKAIWDDGKTREKGVDISLPELMDIMREEYGKDYARTTVATFLLRLSDKGYIHNYRKGKFSYSKILKSEDEYRKELAKETNNFWFRGDTSSFLAALHDAGSLTGENLKKAREYLERLDH